MDNNISFLKKRLLEFVVFLMITGLIFLAPFTDVLILENTISEFSVTELLQEISLAIITGIFIYLSLRHSEIKYGMTLIAGFFLCMLIREMDFATDQIPFFSWFYFVFFQLLKIKIMLVMG